MHGGDCLDQGLEGKAVVGVGGRDRSDQWQPLGVGQDVKLGAGFASVHRVRPDELAPFFARTEAESTRAADQSIAPAEPSRSRTSMRRRRHNPDLVQAANRRCAMAGLTPKQGGNRRQAHEVVSAYTIAVNTFRSATGAVPPPCRRGRNAGISGAAISHSPSGTKSRPRSAAMVDDHAPWKHTPLPAHQKTTLDHPAWPPNLLT